MGSTETEASLAADLAHAVEGTDPTEIVALADALEDLGDLAYSDAYAQLEAVSHRLRRIVNPTIYTTQELARRVERKEAFATRVLAQPKLWLIGGEDALGL